MREFKLKYKKQQITVGLGGRTSLSVRKYLIFYFLCSLGICDSLQPAFPPQHHFSLACDFHHSTQSPGSVLIPIPFFFSPLQLPATSLLSKVFQQAQGSCSMIYCQPAGQIPQILTFHGIINLGFLPWQSCHFFRKKQELRALSLFQTL